jgi:hypothetical protein
MNTKSPAHDITIEAGSGNPYAVLGLPDADDVMRVKADLARQIPQIIKARHLTQLGSG